MRRSALFAALLIPVVANAGFRASSFRKETKLGANYWNVAAALDSKPETCWMVDPELESSVDQWFEVDLPKGTIDRLGMMIGWEKDDESFKDYARVKTVKVEIFGSPDDENKLVAEHKVTFEDKRGMQVLDLPDAAIGGELHGGRARVTVVEVYPGEDYPNLAVSEILLHLKEQDVPGGVAKLKTPPATAHPDHFPDSLIDGDAKTYWASEGAGEQTFDLRAEGFGVSSIGLHPGPTTYARPKTIEVVANDIPVRYTLADKPELQWFAIPAVVGYTGSAWGSVTVRVLDTYPGKTDQSVAITEVKLRYTNFEAL